MARRKDLPGRTVVSAREDVASYIGSQTLELAFLAEGAGLGALGCLLRMAELEARKAAGRKHQVSKAA